MDYNSLAGAKIQFGDTVSIITSEGGIWSYQDAVVINVPQDTGDLWQVQYPDGSVSALNPYHSSFIRIEKAPKS